MHLAGEPVKPLPFQDHEDLTKDGGYNDRHLTSGVNADDEVNKRGVVSFMSLEQVLDRSILRDKAGEYVGADLDSTDCKQNGYKLDPVPLCLPENEVVRRETEFYMNKVVRDVEQPKMILCYKEGSYDIVKDICVDEGLHSLDGALSENEVKKYVKSSNDFELNSLKLASLSEQLHLDLSGEDTDHTSSGDLPEEGEDMSGTVDSSDGQQSTQDEHHVSDPGGEDPKHSSVEIASVEPHEKNIGGMLSPPVEPVSRQSPRRSGRRYSLAELLAEDKKDSGPYGAPLYSSEILRSPKTNELLPQQEPDTEQSHAHMPSSESNLGQTELVAGQPQTFDSQSGKPRSIQGDSDSSQCPDQDGVRPPSSSADRAIEGASEKPEPSTSITTSEDIKDENEADSGVKTEAFDAAVPEKESLGGSSEIQPSGFPSSETQNKNVNAPMVASRPSFYRGNGDSNLLGPSFLSGRMYSGHLQYSGSVSLRSDSSTTSTRSFAFPVLQSEWNSSPIKMVEGGGSGGVGGGDRGSSAVGPEPSSLILPIILLVCRLLSLVAVYSLSLTLSFSAELGFLSVV